MTSNVNVTTPKSVNRLEYQPFYHHSENMRRTENKYKRKLMDQQRSTSEENDSVSVNILNHDLSLGNRSLVSQRHNVFNLY